MARRNISVPDDLAARMDRLDQVNWSRVAQAAFEAEFRFHPEWKEDRMTTVIERLRASKEAQAKDGINDGFGDGKRWAEEDAEFAELKALGEAPDLDESEAGDGTLWKTVPSTIGRDGNDFSIFWQDATRHRIGDLADLVTDYYVIGFVRGAKAVWEEVEDKL